MHQMECMGAMHEWNVASGSYDDDGNEGDEGDEGGSSSSGGGSTSSSAECTAQSSGVAFSASKNAYIVALAESFDLLCDPDREDQLDVKVPPTRITLSSTTWIVLSEA